eukprot:10866010-Lingulodinium_polyedra.AAC.1
MERGRMRCTNRHGGKRLVWPHHCAACVLLGYCLGTAWVLLGRCLGAAWVLLGCCLSAAWVLL